MKPRWIPSWLDAFLWRASMRYRYSCFRRAERWTLEHRGVGITPTLDERTKAFVDGKVNAALDRLGYCICTYGNDGYADENCEQCGGSGQRNWLRPPAATEESDMERDRR